MGIDRVLKMLIYEVIFWAAVLSTNYLSGYRVDVFANMTELVLLSLLLALIPYWPQRRRGRIRLVRQKKHESN